MATKEQMDFFKALYDEESARTGILREHAKNNLSLATLYSAFIIFIIPNSESAPLIQKVSSTLSIGFMLSSFILSMIGSQVADFYIPISPNQLIDGYGKSPPNNEDFFDDRIIDYADATETNTVTNNKKAKILVLARIFLAVGIVTQASYFIMRLWLIGGTHV